MEATWIFEADTPDAAAEGLGREFDRALKGLEEALRGASRGSTEAARRYVELWNAFASDVLEAAATARPDVVVRDAGGQLILVEYKECTRDLILDAAPVAALSPWISSAGLATGLGLWWLAELRTAVRSAPPLRPPGDAWRPWADLDQVRTAIRLVRLALVHHVAPRLESSPLERVAELYGLDRPGLAGLFGVSRQAVEQWEVRGVPAERQAKLTAVLAIGELLERKLRPGVLPGVARTPAEAYGGRTMLELIAADRHDWLLQDVRDSFDWASTA